MIEKKDHFRRELRSQSSSLTIFVSIFITAVYSTTLYQLSGIPNQNCSGDDPKAYLEYNLHIMKDNKLPPLQKIIASIFALVFIASLFFIGYRIYTKPAYEAHEQKQARLLAVSAVSLFSDKTAREPGIW
ncbi:MAG: hypothetical protein AB7U37_07105, partial [Synergistaceae bacterium]